jgi:hypothetical protein
VLSRWQGGVAALVVTLVTGALVILDVTDVAVRRWWAFHALTTDTVAGLLVRHEPLLLAGVSLQFLLVIIGFSDAPAPGLNREIGAYLALIAWVAAVGPVVRPTIRAWRSRR